MARTPTSVITALRHRTQTASAGTRRGADTVESTARQAKRRPAVRRLARISIMARAVVYLVLGYITADIAMSGRGAGPADSQGVLERVAREPAGPFLVAVLAAGFALYAGWRLLQAAAGDDTEDEGTEWAKRVGWAGIGVGYLVLCVQALLVLTAGGTGGGDPSLLAARTAALPGGRALLFAIGLGVAVGGVGLAVWAALQRFEVYLPDHAVPAGADMAARALGTLGSVVRGLVFAGVGASFVTAAVAGSPRDAKGVDSALLTLRHHAYGTWLLALAAAGFVAFGLMSVLEARYRDL